MNKYRNRRVQYDGRSFDSAWERDRYIQLRALESAGEIFALECQKKLPLYAICLTPPLRPNPYDNLEKIGDYIADFVYEDASGRRVIEDAKGMKKLTDLFSWKRRHVEIQYGVTILLTRRDGNGSNRKRSKAPRFSAKEAKSLTSNRRNKKRS